MYWIKILQMRLILSKKVDLTQREYNVYFDLFTVLENKKINIV